jgi:serine/threonine-protein kinase PknK
VGDDGAGSDLHDTVVRAPVPQVPGFHNLAEIGRGGFSVVYAAQATDSDEPVALKIFNVGSSDAATRRRFDREVAALHKLTDVPGVVAVRCGCYTADGRPCLAMELMSGGSLADRVKLGVIPLDEVFEVADVATTALAEVHERGVLHRDLKPQNLLLHADGHVAIADFGIAGLGEMELASQTMASLSPPHAPPERFSDAEDPSSITGDVYSLASTLFELLEGHPPFGTTAEGGLAGLMGRVISDPLPRLSRPDAPIGLQEVLERAVAKAPAARHPDMATLAADLRRCRNNPPVGAHTPGAPEDRTVQRVPLAGTDAEGDGPSGEPAADIAPEGSRPRARTLLVLAAGVALVVLGVLGAVVARRSPDDLAAVASRTRDRGAASATSAKPSDTATTTLATTAPGSPPSDPNTTTTAPGDLPSDPAAALTPTVSSAEPQGSSDTAPGGAAAAPGGTASAGAGPASVIPAAPAPNVTTAAPATTTPPVTPPPPTTPPATVPPATAPPTTAAKVLGDLNGDGVVGCRDIEILLADWNKTGSGLVSDLNGDNKVTIQDLSIILSKYTGDGTSSPQCGQ